MRMACLLKKKKILEKLGFWQFTYVIVTVYFIAFESVIVSRNTCRPCYVSKRFIAAAFESSELLHLLRLNVRVSTIPTRRVYRLSDILMLHISFMHTPNVMYMWVCYHSYLYTLSGMYH